MTAAPIAQQSAQEAYELVLASAGASLPKRDAADVRVITMVRTGKTTYKNSIIDTPADVGGWPSRVWDMESATIRRPH